MANQTATLDVEITKADQIAEALLAAGFELESTKDSIWRGRKKGTTATFYKTGKLVVQGALTSRLIDWLARKRLVQTQLGSQPDRIGTDEAGKGDYFGPLVTAAVLVTTRTEQSLFTLGVRDSKKMSDRTAVDLSREIRQECPHSVVAVGPKRYNELQKELRSVNRVLGWAHARAIENILEKFSCNTAIADQFGDEAFILSALMQKGKSIRLIQKPRAEQDIAVAAASVLARAEFLDSLRRLSEKYGISLPKGASDEVIKVAKSFVANRGASKLAEVAKLHFRTTTQVLSSGFWSS